MADFHCDNCSTSITSDNWMAYEDSHMVCELCYDGVISELENGEAFRCDQCDSVFPMDSHCEIDGEIVCDHCYDLTVDDKCERAETGDFVIKLESEDYKETGRDTWYCDGARREAVGIAIEKRVGSELETDVTFNYKGVNSELIVNAHYGNHVDNHTVKVQISDTFQSWICGFGIIKSLVTLELKNSYLDIVTDNN